MPFEVHIKRNYNSLWLKILVDWWFWHHRIIYYYYCYYIKLIYIHYINQYDAVVICIVVWRLSSEPSYDCGLILVTNLRHFLIIWEIDGSRRSINWATKSNVAKRCHVPFYRIRTQKRDCPSDTLYTQLRTCLQYQPRPR